ncbi:hypothetical protein Aazo_3832 ['Nostoc azollae' 0708]|uniref:Uncharacterized protein n=1 Tax=Nostoc azollae (strain 0708) TaxID=551115 RepID=D7E4N8_NOSA0|nr:hypothetical protein Aazo_3832 ['Nostoc azollae' 0708]
MAIETAQKYLFRFSHLSVYSKCFFIFFIVIEDKAFNDFEPGFQSK